MADTAMTLIERRAPDYPAPTNFASGDVIRCLMMDDSGFDRRQLRRVASTSRYKLEFTETSTVAETLELLQQRSFDLLVLDYRVPDGDGVALAAEVASGPRRLGTPVIVLTGEGNEQVAIQALRAGAADYLAKSEINTASFEGAVANALERSSRDLDQAAIISNLRAENDALRRTALVQMRRLKGQVMPLLSYAWGLVGKETVCPRDTTAEERRLDHWTRAILGLVDDVVIHAATSRANQFEEPVALGVLIDRLLREEDSEIAAATPRVITGELPVVLAVRPKITMLFETLILGAIRSTPLGTVSDISIGSSEDAEGNVIVWVSDNGGRLVRQRNVSHLTGGAAGLFRDRRRDDFGLSLAARTAEQCGASIRIADGRILIRFPTSLVVPKS